MSTESPMLFNHLILCCPFSSCPQSFPASFSNELALCSRWPEFWSFGCGTSPSNEYSRLISFKIGWFDFLVVQGTLKGLLQHHSSKATILWHSAFFIVQLSCQYMTAGKTVSLTIRTFVGKVMSLLFNTLSMFVIAFLPRSKHLLSMMEIRMDIVANPISWDGSFVS